MTTKEQCEHTLSLAMRCPCDLSLTVAGHLRIGFESHAICFDKDDYTVKWVQYMGSYERLLQAKEILSTALKKYEDLFKEFIKEKESEKDEIN